MNSLQPGPSGLQSMDDDQKSDYFDLYTDYNKKQKIYLAGSDDSQFSFEEKPNIIHDQLESNDNEMTFEEEDSESDEELESEELDDLFVDAKDVEEWMCDYDFAQSSFKGKAGLQSSPKGLNPYDFFELLFDDNFFSLIVRETNKYAKSKRDDQFKKLTLMELKKFVGLLLHMGTIKCGRLQNYWSTHRLFNFTCFSHHMSRNRFQDILRSLHFFSNDGSSNCLNKVQPIIDYFNSKMNATYYPGKEPLADETAVPWRVRLGFRQFITGKKRKGDVKLYVLTESSGVALRIKVFTQSGDDINSKVHVTQALLRLLEDESKRQEKFEKPLVLHKCNESINGIDRKGQVLCYYTCSRTSFKWHIKLWINVVETLLLNSFVLYSKYFPVTKKLTFYDFRLSIIDTLLFQNCPKNAIVIVPESEHTPEILLRGKDNRIKRKRCRQCFAHNIRKETNYYCGACQGNPGLCLGKCFKEFHFKIFSCT